ncbi:SPT20 (YOL148C) [Zygosaccharomyces parabailii]|nr:SPT20 (YOL148C) [Zygosaccharomyces parabailii]CDH09509.1 related to SPT20-Member of the TBP class of SPT proteins that alter transcription site selection [Zygosaccharomyces bailii ISA1307]
MNAGSNGMGIPVNARASMQRSMNPALQQQALKQQQQQQMQQQAQQQHRQRMLLQQRALQQQKHQQALQNYESQFYQLLMTLNKRPKRIYNFTEDTDSTLRKYEQYRPSFEFHIYENNYKICAPANTRLQQQQKTPELTSDGLILNKNNSILKEFLEYVARGIIPASIMEVLRDCNIQFYEGNLILQVYDHTNTVDVTARDKPAQQHTQQQQQHQSGTAASPPNDSKRSPSAESDASRKIRSTTFKRPRVYRTLLKPNDLTHYYDMMSYADQTRFSDSIYQQLESEVLSLTKRNLALDVPLDPYEHRDKLENGLFATPYWNSEKNCFRHVHRQLSQREGTKGSVGHIEQHEEFPQHSSNYEQLMLIMSERTTTSTNATYAASLTSGPAGSKNALKMGGSMGHSSSPSATGGSDVRGGSASGNQVAISAAAAAAAAGLTVGNENNQFSRLKFIEQWRVNKEKRRQQAMNNNLQPSTYHTRISMAAPLTPQQQLLQQQQQQQQIQQQMANRSLQGGQIPMSEAQQNKASKNRAAVDKSKQKRPRKTTRKAEQEPTKKKRGNKKKQDEE